MTDDQREALIAEYQALSGFIEQFFTLRATILGLGAAMAGALLSTSFGAQGAMQCALDLTTVGLLYVMEEMIGSNVRGVYVFGSRLTDISARLGETGYWVYWRRYLTKRPEDGGQRTYLIALRFLIVACGGFLLLRHLPPASRLIDGHVDRSSIAHAAILALSCPFLLWRFFRVDRALDPRRFVRDIQAAWDQTCADIEPQDDSLKAMPAEKQNPKT